MGSDTGAVQRLPLLAQTEVATGSAIGIGGGRRPRCWNRVNKIADVVEPAGAPQPAGVRRARPKRVSARTTSSIQDSRADRVASRSKSAVSNSEGWEAMQTSAAPMLTAQGTVVGARESRGKTLAAVTARSGEQVVGTVDGVASQDAVGSDTGAVQLLLSLVQTVMVPAAHDGTAGHKDSARTAGGGAS